ncbi:hypothetical protein PoB_007323400 [Plakobranchus ocellatus]|uniref:Uncharacterized protein n=1 Tax=Plakobranchus ocellatus TaxID=259542 RepID=A0AAV4DRB9_9GAST|nr:hypothetical protein PoB_007323400 [Plakobranchus ocellatus]
MKVKGHNRYINVLTTLLNIVSRVWFGLVFSYSQSSTRLSDPPLNQGTGGGVQPRDRRVPADLRVDLLPTVPSTPRRPFARARLFQGLSVKPWGGLLVQVDHLLGPGFSRAFPSSLGADCICKIDHLLGPGFSRAFPSSLGADCIRKVDHLLGPGFFQGFPVKRWGGLHLQGRLFARARLFQGLPVKSWDGLHVQDRPYARARLFQGLPVKSWDELHVH